MTDELHRIDLEELDAERYAGGYVDIKPVRRYGDTLKISTALMVVQIGEPTVLNQEAAAYARMETAIVEWSIPGIEGPPSRAAFEALPSELGEWLLEQIEGFYAKQGRTPEQAKTSGSSRSSRQAARGASRRS